MSIKQIQLGGKEAAGWVKNVESRDNDGLWYLVEWNDEAAENIKAKKFRYFSPEFVRKWTHPATNVTFNDVLFWRCTYK